MKYARCTDLRRHLADFLDLVQGGDSVVLLRRGEPVARLVPFDGELVKTPSWRKPRVARSLRGESIVATLRRERDS